MNSNECKSGKIILNEPEKAKMALKELKWNQGYSYELYIWAQKSLYEPNWAETTVIAPIYA